MLSTCLPTGPPRTDVTEAQLQLLTDSLDAIHLEVAAARRPSTWSFALFLLSILLPLCAAIWLVFRAERSALDHDAGIRTMLSDGLSQEVVLAYLEISVGRPQLTGPTLNQQRLPKHVSQHRRPRRRRRRWSSRRDDRDSPPSG